MRIKVEGVTFINNEYLELKNLRTPDPDPKNDRIRLYGSIRGPLMNGCGRAVLLQIGDLYTQYASKKSLIKFLKRHHVTPTPSDLNNQAFIQNKFNGLFNTH